VKGTDPGERPAPHGLPEICPQSLCERCGFPLKRFFFEPGPLLWISAESQSYKHQYLYYIVCLFAQLG
jgi:hypothetical protein